MKIKWYYWLALAIVGAVGYGVFTEQKKKNDQGACKLYAGYIFNENRRVKSMADYEARTNKKVPAASRRVAQENLHLWCARWKKRCSKVPINSAKRTDAICQSRK